MAEHVIEDTTNFFLIKNGDLIRVGQRVYKIIGHAHESQFGIDDPKLWVLRAVDSESKDRKILKLAFFETFYTTLGGAKIRCFRSPEKEANILKITRNNPHFMKGRDYKDVMGNNIRVLDVVRGKNYLLYIDSFKMTYERYFKTVLPGVLLKLIDVFKAINFLHLNGFRHGDIRNDHLFVERETGNFVWIDFDYDFEATENPFSLDIFGLGTILSYTIGKGFHTAYMITNDRHRYGDLIDKVDGNDFSLLDRSMLLNLKKLYPIIPRPLNDILMHFSRSADVYYEFVDEILEDLNYFMQSWLNDTKKGEYFE